MKTPKSEKPSPTLPPESNSEDIRSQLAALDAEENALTQRTIEEERAFNQRKAEQTREFAQRKAAQRAAAFDKLMADLRTQIRGIVAMGFELAAIGKAQGFTVAKSRPTLTSPNKPSGPTTHTGWFNLFRSRAIQAYLRSHPDLAAQLKADAVQSVDYATHIPDSDLAAIDSAARASAEQRCPSIPPTT